MYGVALCAGLETFPMGSVRGRKQFLVTVLGLGLLLRVSQSYQVFELPLFDQEEPIKLVEGAESSCKRGWDFFTLTASVSFLALLLMCMLSARYCMGNSWLLSFGRGRASSLIFVLVTIIVLQAVNSTELSTLKFPAFLPPDVKLLREPVAREMAARMQHVPVQVISLPL